MRPVLRFNLPRLIAPLLLCAAGLAHAQWSWIDGKGVRHFSDRPPPPDTPASKILKAPGKHADPLGAPEAGDATVTDAAPAKNKQPTVADREADYRKRQQDRAKEEKKSADEAQRQQAQRANCEDAQRYKNSLESGMRIAETGNDGEQRWMSDEDRAKRLAETNNVLAGCR
jgi:hypothetical protein